MPFPHTTSPPSLNTPGFVRRWWRRPSRLSPGAGGLALLFVTHRSRGDERRSGPTAPPTAQHRDVARLVRLQGSAVTAVRPRLLQLHNPATRRLEPDVNDPEVLSAPAPGVAGATGCLGPHGGDHTSTPSGDRGTPEMPCTGSDRRSRLPFVAAIRESVLERAAPCAVSGASLRELGPATTSVRPVRPTARSGAVTAPTSGRMSADSTSTTVRAATSPRKRRAAGRLIVQADPIGPSRTHSRARPTSTEWTGPSGCRRAHPGVRGRRFLGRGATRPGRVGHLGDRPIDGTVNYSTAARFRGRVGVHR